jgi:zona occludens toxin (predicted ATPase)
MIDNILLPLDDAIEERLNESSLLPEARRSYENLHGIIKEKIKQYFADNLREALVKTYGVEKAEKMLNVKI